MIFFICRYIFNSKEYLGHTIPQTVIKPCKIHFPTELGTETWKGFADAPGEKVELIEIPYAATSWNNAKIKIEPYKLQINSINDSYIEEWIEMAFGTITSRISYGAPYKKTIVVQFDDVEYKLLGCYPTEISLKNENCLTRFVIFEKQNNFNKSAPYELILSVDSYSIGYY